MQFESAHVERCGQVHYVQHWLEYMVQILRQPVSFLLRSVKLKISEKLNPSLPRTLDPGKKDSLESAEIDGTSVTLGVTCIRQKL